MVEPRKQINRNLCTEGDAGPERARRFDERAQC
jgi:hypothetical protein